MTEEVQPPRYEEVEGTVKFFNPKKGHGYIEPDDKTLGDILLPVRCLEEHGKTDIDSKTRIRCKTERRRRDNRLSVKKILSFA